MLTGFSLGQTLKSAISNTKAALFNDYLYIPMDKLRVYFNFGQGNSFKSRNKLKTLGEGCITNGSLSNQNIEIPSANLKVGADLNFTIMFWFKSSTNNKTLLDCQDSADSSKGLKWTLKSNGRITCGMKDDDGTSANDLDSGGSTTNDDGVWHHLACSFDRLGSRHQYIDGELDRSKDVSGLDKTIDVDLPWHLMNNNQATVGNNGLVGSMKNFGIWHRELTQSEINNLRYKTYGEFSKAEKIHLKGWYPLETNANDSTGNQNGTITSGTGQAFSSEKYGGNTPILPRTKDNDKRVYGDSIGSGSAYFDGTDDYIEVGDMAAFTTEGTVMMWVKIIAGSTDRAFLSKYNATNNKREWMMQWGTDETVKWNVQPNPAAYSANYRAESSTVLTTRVWTHLTGTCKVGEKAKLYINGVLDCESASNLADAIDDTDAPVFMGKYINGSSSTYFNYGNMAQVAIFNTRLTQGDITRISQKTYAELTTSEKSSLVSWWALDEEYLPTELWDGSKADSDVWNQGGSDDDLDIRYLTHKGGDYFLITHVADTTYADMYLTNAGTSLTEKFNTLKSTMDVNSTYKLTFQAKVNTGSCGVTGSQASASSTTVNSTEYVDYEFYYETDSAVGYSDEYLRVQSLSAGEKVYLRNISVKKLKVQDSHGSNHGSVSGA